MDNAITVNGNITRQVAVLFGLATPGGVDSSR